jgi:O-methyltransferase
MSQYESQADPSVEPAPDETSESAPDGPKKEKRPRDPDAWIHRPMHKYRKGRHTREFRPDPAFFALADVVQAAGRTLLGYDRLYAFWQAIRNLAPVPGVAAEVGSYRGGSAYFIASALKSFAGEDVPLHVFDTFAGHPAAAISESDNYHQPGQFGDNDYDEVREYLSPFPQVTFHRGDVLESLKTLEDATYRLVHLDTDLYLPTKVCLEYFEPRLSSGGIIMLDDYASKRCEGVRSAVVEYLDTTDVFQVWDLRTEQLLLVKR